METFKKEVGNGIKVNFEVIIRYFQIEVSDQMFKEKSLEKAHFPGD
jgi:hypothetical protein